MPTSHPAGDNQTSLQIRLPFCGNINRGEPVFPPPDDGMLLRPIESARAAQPAAAPLPTLRVPGFRKLAAELAAELAKSWRAESHKKAEQVFKTFRMTGSGGLQRCDCTKYTNAGLQKLDSVNKQTSDESAANLSPSFGQAHGPLAAQTSPALDKLPGHCLRVSATLRRR